jgi:GNAT superfamily N-acetyltransferase
MRTVRVKTTYLQMLAPVGASARRAIPATRTQPPMEGIEIVRAEKPAVAFYRWLYDCVGRDWNWVDRALLSDEDLGHIIHDPLVEIYVPYVNGAAAGYAELDRRKEGEIELAYFGIIPQLSGKGLGRYLLDWTIRKAWSYHPRRLWLHTCELDHEAALPMYLSAGFEVVDERMVEQVIL